MPYQGHSVCIFAGYAGKQIISWCINFQKANNVTLIIILVVFFYDNDVLRVFVEYSEKINHNKILLISGFSAG